MERFVFRLEQVMEFRRRLEENLLGEKADLDREVAEKRNVVALLDTLRQKEQEDLRQVYAGRPVDPDEIGRIRAYLEVLGGRGKLAEEDLQEAQERREECVRRLLEARKARRTLERLKGRRWLEYQQRSLAELQKELDETGAVRWLRDDGSVPAPGGGAATGRRSNAGDA